MKFLEFPFSIILAMVQVESGGNLMAVGDNGKSFGPLQISVPYAKDAIQFWVKEYGWVEAPHVNRASLHSFEESMWLMTGYMRKFCTSKRLKRTPTIADVLAIHNGGPNGAKKKSAKEYIQKVEKAHIEMFGRPMGNPWADTIEGAFKIQTSLDDHEGADVP